MAATPPNANHSPAKPGTSPTLPGVLLDRVRRTWADVRAPGAGSHEPFLVAVGALAVYARAVGVPVADVVRTVHAVLAADPADRPGPAGPSWRAIVRETVVRNYARVD